MGRFVAGEALASAIQDICSGGEARCAVAFWGQGIPNVLFGANISEARVICDIEMGGTNPVALKELRAPQNERLRHHPRLHAKVYISDRGVVTASANASLNGLGSADQPLRLSEAGVHSTSNSDHWKEADRWFEELWLTSNKVDSDTLARAEESWTRTSNARALVEQQNIDKPLRLSDLLRDHPAVFGDVHFLFTNGQGDEEVLGKAIEEAEEVNGVGFAQTLRGMQAFTHWGGPSDVLYRFIAVHRGPRGGYWATLDSPGVYTEAHDVYFANHHQVHDPLFSDLQNYLDLGGYVPGKGYRLGLNHFSAEQFDKLVEEFHTAEELSRILFGK